MLTELYAAFKYENSEAFPIPGGVLSTRDFDEVIEELPLPAFMSDVDLLSDDYALKLVQRFYFFALIEGKLKVLRWSVGDKADSACISIERQVMLADLVATHDSSSLQEPKMFDLFFSAWMEALTEEFTFTTETRANEDGEYLPLVLDLAQVFRLSRISHVGFFADFAAKRLVQHVGVFIPTNIDFYRSSSNFEDAAYVDYKDLDRENVTYGEDEDLVLDAIAADVSPAMWAIGIRADN